MLRGLVILIMALDHVREYLSIVKGIDTSTMTPAYFFTRWITHFCAPVFVFLAGTSAFLSMGGGRRTVQQLSRFLVTRGLWLILMEWTVIGFGFFFNTDLSPPASAGSIQVIWVLGASMIVLAGLVRLPMWVSVVMGVRDGRRSQSAGWREPRDLRRVGRRCGTSCTCQRPIMIGPVKRVRRSIR